VSIGLAWTPAGGEVLFIEASRMPGSALLTLTGQLGDVMKESARAALSWLRANGERFGITGDFFRNAEIHLHVPSGAIPKDGPSAGVAMVTALASEMTGRPVRGDLAMTGEITLSGRVLPVGGIKEKVLAARRVGIRHVALPWQNEKNIMEDISEDLRRDITVHFVSTIDEVLELALVPAPASPPDGPDSFPGTAESPVTAPACIAGEPPA
jgi:ATP-dependent Lon protease